MEIENVSYEKEFSLDGISYCLLKMARGIPTFEFKTINIGSRIAFYGAIGRIFGHKRYILCLQLNQSLVLKSIKIF